jgi:RHH-type proline utilization regulon transcriptional repressor/proline dehydrogenase/delta 1-pyrroline-5-carboxylate dehydrogenase
MSVPTGLKSPAVALLEQLTESWAGDIEFVEESDEQLIAAIAGRQTDRVRYAAAARVPQTVLKAAAAAGVGVATNPVSGQGRLELLWYLHEQSVSIDYHRYGNLGSRVAEPRAEVL